VKVDPSLIALGKENVEPLQCCSAKKLHGFDDEAAKKMRVEEEARMKQEEEEAARMAAQALARQRAAAAEERQRNADQAAREAREAREAQMAAQMEAARLAEEARVSLEAEEDKKKAAAHVNAWCKANGYPHMNAQKKKLFGGTKYPLHEAVAKKQVELVKMMVKAGVDTSVKNSKGETASELASKSNKNGVMNDILEVLA